MLRCEGFGVGFGARVILAEVDLELPPLGVTALMGPGGTGKSTLLNSLAGLYLGNSFCSTWGDAFYKGAPLRTGNRPAFVAQRIQLTRRSVLDNLTFHIRSETALTAAQRRDWARDWLAKLFLHDLAEHLDTSFVQLSPVFQRIVAVLRETSTNPALLMIDEPTSGLSNDDAFRLLGLLETIARSASVLVVLHNQKQARRISENIILLAGGRVQAQAHTQRFFEGSLNAAVAQFVTTGSCSLPAPDARLEFLAENAAAPPDLPPAALAAMQSKAGDSDGFLSNGPRGAAEGRFGANATYGTSGPRGFVWLLEGRLAGTPYPGAVHDVDYDLELLKNAGVTTLITLTEKNFSQDALARLAMDNFHCAIVDRRAPTIAQAEMLIAHMSELLKIGKVLAVHCRAGVGRTGLVLAAYLIGEKGFSAQDAMTRVRTLNPEFIQTREQEAFLFEYECAAAQRRS
ncbi:MAG: ABC transporter [Methylocystaceae bacterium]|nr:MAG: ABC transporter [Methylocystaceae bacterium]